MAVKKSIKVDFFIVPRGTFILKCAINTYIFLYVFIRQFKIIVKIKIIIKKGNEIMAKIKELSLKEMRNLCGSIEKTNLKDIKWSELKKVLSTIAKQSPYIGYITDCHIESNYSEGCLEMYVWLDTKWGYDNYITLYSQETTEPDNDTIDKINKILSKLSKKLQEFFVDDLEVLTKFYYEF